MTHPPERPGSAKTVPYLDTLVAAVYTTLRDMDGNSLTPNPDAAILRQQLRFGLNWWRSMLDSHRPEEHPTRGYVCPACRTTILRRRTKWPCAVWERTAVYLATMTVLEARLEPPRKPAVANGVVANGKRVAVPIRPYEPRHLVAG